MLVFLKTSPPTKMRSEVLPHKPARQREGCPSTNGRCLDLESCELQNVKCEIASRTVGYMGTPKSSILIGFSIINHPFWGTPIFGNTHIVISTEYPYMEILWNDQTNLKENNFHDDGRVTRGPTGHCSSVTLPEINSEFMSLLLKKMVRIGDYIHSFWG